MNLEQIRIGEFEVTGDALVISDPCYEPGTWCMGHILDAKPGIWEAFIGMYHDKDFGDRVAYLAAYHKDCPDKSALKRLPAEFEVGVDSGQAGIFDRAHYQDPSVIGDDSVFISDDRWYDACCKQTCHTPRHAGVIPYGAVSQSGYGDGGYTCYYFANGGGSEFTTWGVVIDFDLVKMRTIMKKLCEAN